MSYGKIGGQGATQFKKNAELLEKTLEKVYSNLSDFDTLNLPKCETEDIQSFYEELECPFFNSETKKQIFELSELQIQLWKQHNTYKMIIIIKSQKIGISSLCILITLWHALTDCMGMELIIQAQSDEQAKSHAQDLRRILGNSPKYKDYLISKSFASLGLLKDEATTQHKIWLHNPKSPRTPTKIIVVGMSQGALLSHKRVGFIWSSDMTISELTTERKYTTWAAMLSRRANSRGPVIIECPARNPDGPIYDAWERYQKQIEMKEKIDPNNDFHVFKYTYKLGLRDGFFDEAFIESEKRRLGPLFGTFYGADFFASGMTWYTQEMIKNVSPEATDLFFAMNANDDIISDVTEN